MMHAVEDAWGIDDVVLADITKGSYREGPALSWWFSMIQLTKPKSVFMDVGAYTGLYSLFSSACRSDTKVVAIEASVTTYARLIQNIVLNGFDVRIVPTHYAASSSVGMVQLGHAFGVMAMASGESVKPNYEVDHFEVVPSTRIDDLLLQRLPLYGPVASRSNSIFPIEAIGGIKIDVEGAECDALAGAQGVISKFRPPMILEVLTQQNLDECKRILGQHRYALVSECPGDNYVFCPAELADDLIRVHSLVATSQDDAFSIKQCLTYSPCPAG